MRSYIQLSTPERVPQILGLVHAATAYRFNVLHVSHEGHPGHAGAGATPQRREHVHDVYHIVMYSGGDNRFLLNGTCEPARPGVLALTGPGDSHCFGGYDPGGVEYMELTFSLRSDSGDLRLPFHQLLGLYAGRDLPDLTMPVELDPTQRRILGGRLAALITQLARPGKHVWFAAFRAIVEILAFLTETVYEGALSPPQDAPLDRVRQEIEQRFAATLLIEDLAAQAHLSPGYFIRAFKARFGLPPIAYQQRMRVRAAQNLLRNTSLLCKEIATRTGFEDVYYFSKVFKKVAGMTPTAFRQREN